MNLSHRLLPAVTPCVILISLNFLSSGPCRVLAHETLEKAQAYTEASRHKPTPFPDRIVLTWSSDPTTSINVTWRTDQSVRDPIVEFAPAASLLGDLRTTVPDRNQVSASTEKVEFDSVSAHIHSAIVSGLKPGTMYAYRVGKQEHFSEWFQFRTASREPKPFSFVYFGDAQNDIRSWWSRVIRESNQYAPRCAFMLHAGDLINDSDNDVQWGEWFEAGGWLNGMIPVVATPGNHEYSEGLSRHWRPQFAFPLNGPPGLEETVYWFDYQGARIISLNSNEGIARQRNWLRAVLDDDQRPKWTFVTFHHPIFSAAKERDNKELREAWRLTLEEFHVDLVLQGHDHSYARSGLGGPKNVPDGIRMANSNTVYVVSVSGPKMYTLQETWDVSRAASGAQLFQVIRVSREAVRYESRMATGKLYDAFTLKKDASGRSHLYEEIPDTPEIHH